MFAPGSAFACVRLCTWRVSSNDALLIQVADVYLRVSLRDIQGSVVPAQANLFPPRACCRWVSVSEIGSTYSKDVAVFAGPGWCHVGRNAAINLWPEVWLSFLCLDMVGMRLATSTPLAWGKRDRSTERQVPWARSPPSSLILSPGKKKQSKIRSSGTSFSPQVPNASAHYSHSADAHFVLTCCFALGSITPRLPSGSHASIPHRTVHGSDNHVPLA